MITRLQAEHVRSRTSGILLHPTSLPGGFGIGDLGPEAHRFVDFLAGARQGLWQVLPLGPTGYGDSPYQCFSAFAGNPLLVSLGDASVDEGWLSAAEPGRGCPPSRSAVDYGAVARFRPPCCRPRLRRASRDAGRTRERRRSRRSAGGAGRVARRLRALHGAQGRPRRARPGPTGSRTRARDGGQKALARARTQWAEAIEAASSRSSSSSRQWAALRAVRAPAPASRIMGDLPIFVAHDSADVWAQPRAVPPGRETASRARRRRAPGLLQRHRTALGQPALPLGRAAQAPATAGGSSASGRVLSLVDSSALDHFRGFEAYWEIPRPRSPRP